MPTQVEERVVGAHPLMAEQFGEQLRDLRLGAGGGLAEFAGGQDLRFRQPGAVDLAVRSDRDLVDHHVGGGSHVLRQRCGHPGADPVDVDS